MDGPDWRTLMAALLTAGLMAACQGAEGGAGQTPGISMAVADSFVPGQLARGAALQTEIRSAGHDCAAVTKTFQQGVRDGGDVWNAECAGGQSYGVISNRDGTTDVVECAAIESITHARCFERFQEPAISPRD